MVIFIIYQTDEIIASYERFLDSHYISKYIPIKIESLSEHDQEYPNSCNCWVINTFEIIRETIESYYPEGLISDCCVISELYEPEITSLSEINPLSDKQTIGAVLGLLVLAFPEVMWLFDSPHNGINSNLFYKLKDNEFIEINHIINTARTKTFYIEVLIKNHFTFLFDPTGLRNSILSNIKGTVYNIYPRNNLAISLDEETSYNILHAYLAYRLNYKVLSINSFLFLDHFLQEHNSFDLIFEDIYLNYPDEPSKGQREQMKKPVNLSNLEVRDNYYYCLKEIPNRIIITSGHQRVDWFSENQEYINRIKFEGKTIETVYKPSSGIFNILLAGGLMDKYWSHRKQILNTYPINGENNIHSANGRFLLIAETLIKKAKLINENKYSVEDYIQGALLTYDALNVLGYRTPTTSLEAVSLRNILEVKAECMFYGIDYNVDVVNRSKDIELEVETISYWFKPSHSKASSLNAQMSIIMRLYKIFEDNCQYDESMACLNRFKHLNRKWSSINNYYMKILHPLRWYIDTLVGSLPSFIGAIIIWPLVFGLLNWFFHINEFIECILGSFMCFYSLQTYPNLNYNENIFTFVIILTGFIHLGIFISHLYSCFMRE